MACLSLTTRLGCLTNGGVGYKDDNRGILILLAISDRNWRIATGLGFQTLLPDDRVAGIGAEMLPELRKGQYSEALLRATTWGTRDKGLVPAQNQMFLFHIAAALSARYCTSAALVRDAVMQSPGTPS